MKGTRHCCCFHIYLLLNIADNKYLFIYICYPKYGYNNWRSGNRLNASQAPPVSTQIGAIFLRIHRTFHAPQASSSVLTQNRGKLYFFSQPRVGWFEFIFQRFTSSLFSSIHSFSSYKHSYIFRHSFSFRHLFSFKHSFSYKLVYIII